jgi:hypothetical protein
MQRAAKAGQGRAGRPRPAAQIDDTGCSTWNQGHQLIAVPNMARPDIGFRGFPDEIDRCVPFEEKRCVVGKLSDCFM